MSVGPSFGDCQCLMLWLCCRFEVKRQQEFQSVDEWLHYINMDKYSEVLHAANIDSLDKVTGLGDKELREMGIKLIGHRNKMTKSIKALKGNSVQ